MAVLNTAGFTANSGITIPTGLNPTMRQAFNNFLVALTDLLLPQGCPDLQLRRLYTLPSI